MSSVAAAGTTLGRYRLLAPLGAGGVGEVWRDHDANLDREVAIKILAPGGFMHRDLKPGNVVLTQNGQPKILDFGLALLLGGGKSTGKLTQAGTILGSLPYMAPEQLLGEADDVRTDIYALGVILFEMTTRRRPFIKERAEALMFEIFGNAPPTVRSLRSDARLALEHLVASCLSKEPSDRPTMIFSATLAPRVDRDV
jgi:serine/threonine protein kinase